MTGEIVESKPSGGCAAALFSVLAILLGALLLAVPKNQGWPVAFLPLGMAAGIWLGRDRRVVFRIAESRLEFEHPEEAFVEYESLESITTRRKRGSEQFPIQLRHRGGTTNIPAELSVSSLRLLHFLDEKLPPFRLENLPDALLGFREEQIAKFGEDRVFSFGGRAKGAEPPSYKWVGGLLGLALSAVFMSTIGCLAQPDSQTEWMEAGLSISFFGVFLAFIIWIRGRSMQKRDTGRSGLIVGPTGIALLQGETKGKMRWDELKAIEHPPVKRFGTRRTADSKRGIGLLVDGGYIVIFDYYNRPSEEIYRILREFWNGGSDSRSRHQ